MGDERYIEDRKQRQPKSKVDEQRDLRVWMRWRFEQLIEDMSSPDFNGALVFEAFSRFGILSVGKTGAVHHGPFKLRSNK